MDVLWSIVGGCLVTVIIYIIYWLTNSIRKDNSLIPFVTSQNYPVIGHAFVFLFDRTSFVVRNKERYGSCFTIKLFNSRMTFILDPRDWPSVIRNAHLEMPSDELGRAFGINMSQTGYKEIDPDIHRLYVKHLLSPLDLEILTARFVQCVRDTMIRDQAKCSDNSNNNGSWHSSGLLELSHMMIFDASARTLFGEIDPSKIVDNFRIFDANIPFFLSSLPDFIYKLFFRRGLEARIRFNDTWLQHVHADNESYLIQERTKRLLEHPEASLYFGGLQTATFWGSVGNTIPAAFWTLFYILRDPNAIKAIKDEIAVHLPTNLLDDGLGTVDGWSSKALAQCVQLESAINETLRMASAAMIYRRCQEDTQIALTDGRIVTVKAGDSVALYPAATHLDGNYFEDPYTYKFDRFVNTEKIDLSTFAPFGIGKAMCSGRLFAKNEIKICTAIILRHIEYEFVDPNPTAIQRMSRIGFGVAPPKEDVKIRYRYIKHN